MIVLDTNVLSEPLRPSPDERVVEWLSRIEEPVLVTSVTVGELLTGARRLPTGRRREQLLSGIEQVLSTYPSSVLGYDERAARAYAVLQEACRTAGRGLTVEDGMIAAICLVHGARLATRNIKDFEGLGLALIDPWSG